MYGAQQPRGRVAGAGSDARGRPEGREPAAGSSGDADYKATISYFLREGWYRHVQEECNLHLTRRGNDPYLLFWRAVAKGSEGSVPEALRELEQLRQKRDVEYPVMVALLHFHRQQLHQDYDACDALSAAIPMTEDTCGEGAALLAARFYAHIGLLDDALRVLGRVLDANSVPQTPIQHQAYALKGWAEIFAQQAYVPGQASNSSSGTLPKPTVGAFVKGNARDLETIMGRTKFYECHKQYDKAIDELNHAIALAAWFYPALLEKSKLFIAQGEFDQAIESLQRVLNQDPNNMGARRLHILATLIKEGVSDHVVTDLIELLRLLDTKEPRNAQVYVQTASCFSRICGRHQRVLELTLAMMERARDIDQENGHFVAEAAYEQTLAGQFDRAMGTYQTAAAFGDGQATALAGVVYCQIQENAIEEAEGQLELLSVLHDSDGPNAPVSFLHALLAWRKSKDMNNQIKHLKDTLKHHYNESWGKSKYDLFEHYTKLNPDFLIEIAEEFLIHSSTYAFTNESQAERKSGPVAMGLEVLEKVSQEVPGYLYAHLLMAKTAYQMKKFNQAQRGVNHCLELDSGSSDVYLLSAQIALAQDHAHQAETAVAQAIANDFKIRNSPIFHLVKAKVLITQGDYPAALSQLEEALRLPGVRDSGVSAGSSKTTAITDRADIFITVAEVLTLMHRLPDAQRYIAEAQSIFRDTPEEVRILVANSELAIKRNDFNSAINMLNSVPAGSPVYVHTQMVKANVYLTYRRDKPRFIQCFQDMTAKSPSFATYMQLGEAYMKIQNPESAVQAFEKALESNPRDSELTARIARAVVSTHDYKKAMLYFEKALQNDPDNRDIRYDLARLYLKQKMYEQSVRIIESGLQSVKSDVFDGKDLPMMISDVKLLRLIAEAYRTNPAGDKERLLNSLRRAKESQRTVLEMVRLESPDILLKQKEIMATVCCDIGKYYEEIKDDDKALEAYTDALRALETHGPSILTLARYYMKKNEVEQCNKQCERLVRMNIYVEEATMIMADLLFLKNEFDEATQKYQELLEKKPNYYHALSKLITLLRRAGKLEEVPRFLTLAEKGDPRALCHAGLKYCKGLYQRYSNDPHEAVTNFNLARRDGEWGGLALSNMIEIYLNPDNENMWDEEEPNPENAESIRVAERLLRELNTMWPGSLQFRVLENYSLMASKTKANIDRALQNFIDMLEQEKDYLPALLGMSVAFMLDKAQNKARNTLKRIAKMPYTQDLADEFERSYLMLSDLYIQRGKFDLAQDLCKRCLSYNKSCGKAWEAMGLIMEKEQSYKDAADCYEKSWKLEHEASATVGYKLAFNYLKAKRYVEAISVCNKVLAQFPDYPKIRKEIMEKAHSSLRP